MEYIKGTTDFKLNNTAVTFGKFDGFHKGHKFLIQEIKKNKDLKTVVFTFDMSLIGFGPKENILSKEEREAFYEELLVDYVIEYPFTKEVKDMSAKQFVKNVIKEKLSAKMVVVGKDFRFGKNGAGDVGFLEDASKECGFTVQICEKIIYEESEISSTRIRNKIYEADFLSANEMLGYEYFIGGIVSEGKKLGRTIGFPTINIKIPSDKITPPNGVYAVRVVIDDDTYCGIANVGVNPTVKNDKEKILETHIFDFDSNVYGKRVKVIFDSFIRPEKKFESVEMLKNQIKLDVQSVKEKICVDKIKCDSIV